MHALGRAYPSLAGRGGSRQLCVLRLRQRENQNRRQHKESRIARQGGTESASIGYGSDRERRNRAEGAAEVVGKALSGSSHGGRIDLGQHGAKQAEISRAEKANQR